MKFLIIKKKWLLYVAVMLCFLFVLGAIYSMKSDSIPTFGNQQQGREIVINMVTAELKSKTDDGKEIEAYRWDPGTIYIPKGEHVTLSIYGANGKEHPFIIEGTDIKGTVKKGQETKVSLRFDKEGIYRLICLTHHNIAQNGQMITKRYIKKSCI